MSGTEDITPRAAAPPKGEPEQFADAVLALLAVARRTRGRLQPLFDDVTVPQLVFLDAVQACGREGIAAVSTYISLSQPTVTQQAAALEAIDLVRRVAATEDRRRRVLTLTERGERLLEAKRAVVAQRLSATWDELNDDEQALAVPLLRHVADLIEHLT
jgi:DNA-binding MarR family transcriptional regulator